MFLVIILALCSCSFGMKLEYDGVDDGSESKTAKILEPGSSQHAKKKLSKKKVSNVKRSSKSIKKGTNTNQAKLNTKPDKETSIEVAKKNLDKIVNESDGGLHQVGDRAIGKIRSGKEINIGLLVPSASNESKVGRDSINAAELALAELGTPDIKIIPIETGIDEAGASNAIKNKVGSNIDALVGPFNPSQLAHASTVIKEKGIVVINCSNNVDLVGASYLHMIGMPFVHQSHRIISYAIQNNITRIHAIIPKGINGSMIRKIITQYEESGDLESSVIIDYENNNKEGVIEDAVERLFYILNRDANQYNNAAILLPQNEYEFRRIANKINAMNSSKISSLHILGGSIFHNHFGKSLKTGSKIWFADIPQNLLYDFHMRFATKYGYTPTSVAACAYDSIALILASTKVTDNKLVFNPSVFFNKSGFEGVQGAFMLDPKGKIKRSLSVFGMSNTGSIVELDRALKSFEIE
ncbi:MAG: ABC transporter substrate-binding protein [Proteobacteria bacterium]|nr:ABC transporter substrate-binding protein [Pseudomonadota bacterium]